MPLSREKIKQYKTIGHNLKPIVTIAQNGLSEGVLGEFERALTDHELVKVKISVTDRDKRKQAALELSTKSGSELIQEIGKVALYYRVSNKKDIKTSNVR